MGVTLCEIYRFILVILHALFLFFRMQSDMAVPTAVSRSVINGTLTQGNVRYGLLHLSE